MIDEKRFETTPIQHIRNLIESIKDGELSITYYDFFGHSFAKTYDVSCTVADVDEFISKYNTLTQALEVIGKSREKLNSAEKLEDVLTLEQIEIWNTYICGFKKNFDAGKYNLDELYLKRENGDMLSDEENKVLENYGEWFEEECLKRFPKRGYTSKFFINRAQRYEYFISQNAPKTVITEEGRCLAEEMILYYTAK